MSYPITNVEFLLKAMVNEERTKVLFAEIDSGFADVLLSFLTLPLGMIVRILKKHYGDKAPAFGSLTSLYNGLANLDSVHFWTEGAKSILLHPRSSSDAERERLILDISDSPPFDHDLLYCTRCKKSTDRNEIVSMYYDNAAYCTKCCGKSMRMDVSEWNSQTSFWGDGVFTIRSSSFVITDDLKIFPTSTGLLAISLGITDMYKAKQLDIKFGFSEVMNLLKASLFSSTPLTDTVFTIIRRPIRKINHGILSYQIGNAPAISNSEKMILRVMVQKSTNKLLYAQAEADFVEFLFSFLIIPLGGVESLLSAKSLMPNIDNFYCSLADIIGHNNFTSLEAKHRMIKPKIPHGYLPINNILPLIEEEIPYPYKYRSRGDFVSLKFPKGEGNYLKQRTFMVTDDLTVTPLCIASTISFLEGMGIPISDVKEVELQVGVKEALDILRASLTSTCALSDALKQPKQE